MNQAAKNLAAKLRHEESYGRNLIVEAYAGTGKTFTIIHGVAWAFGSDDLWEKVCDKYGEEIFPSDAQANVWEWMNHNCDPETITYSAFNKSIVTEFEKEYQWIVDLLQAEGIRMTFGTLNRLGNQAVRANGWAKVSKYKTFNILETDGFFGKPFKKYMGSDDKKIAIAVNELVSKAKLTLTGWDGDKLRPTMEDMADLAMHFDVENATETAFELSIAALLESKTWKDNREIDFDDQNWLPIVNGWEIRQADLLLVDEAQDLNRSKAEFAFKAGKQRILVGDRYQAIYGWAGADTASLDNCRDRLESTGGCDVLSLNETFRCPQNIVALCNDHVEDFEALEEAPEGIVDNMAATELQENLVSGDMVLCRVNAPLFSLAFRLLKEGVKVVMRGRDFAEALRNQIRGFWKDGMDCGDVLSSIDDWYQKEFNKLAKRRNNEAALIALEDKHLCFIAFIDGCDSLGDVEKRLEIFDDRSTEGILLTSIHRAKGLEANHVYFYQKDAPCPHPMATSDWAVEQEYNLLYVARTRAKQHLTMVN